MRYLFLLVVGFLVGCDGSQEARTSDLVETRPAAVVPVAIEAPEDPEEPEPAPVPAAPSPPPDPDPVAKLKGLRYQYQMVSTALRQAADQVDDNQHIGTALNELLIPEARCFAKGIMLGMESTVWHLHNNDKPDVDISTEDEAFDARARAHGLENYMRVIEATINRDREEILVEWNLDCPGKFEIPLNARLAQPQISSFYRVENDGHVLRVLGDIEPGFADKVIAALRANPTVKTVSLGSGGGLVSEAMRAGAFIRQGGYDTVLWNGCYSACPLVFLGGVERQVWSPYPEFGFHQMYLADGSIVPLDYASYEPVARYVSQMGADARFVISQMWSAPPEGMTVIQGYEEVLCKANFVTWIQRNCSGSHYGW